MSFHDDGQAQRQGMDAWRHAGVAADVAPELEDEVAEAIGHPGQRQTR